MNRVHFPMDDDAENIEDLETHGYIFSDSDSESSSDNDANNSTTISNRNCTRARPNLKTSVLTDSAQNSDFSDFDDDYYAVQPPALPLNEFKGKIVKIKAKKVWENNSEASRYRTQLCSKSTNSKNVSEAFGIPKNHKQQQIINTQRPLKNVWCTTNDFNNRLKTQLPDKKIRIGDTSCSLANNSIEEFLGHLNETMYLKEFPPLPQRKRNGINQSNSNNTEFCDVSNVRNNFDDYLQEFSSLAEPAKNVTERSATSTLPIHTDQLVRCPSNTLNTKKIGCCLQEFSPLPQSNESEGVAVNPSSVRAFNKGLYLSEVLKRVNGFTFSQELSSPSELNRNRRLSNSSSLSIDTTETIACLPNAVHTTLIGDTQADLCYSVVSNAVNDLSYSEELPSVPELNKNRRLSLSTLSIDSTENIARLPNAVHTTLIRDTQADSCYSEVLNGVNDFTYSEELPSLPELNKNRKLSSSSSSIDTTENIARLPNAVHTTLIGDTQEDLCYSEVSNGVNDLTYLKELPSVPELNKNRRLSSSTLLIDTTENIARLPNALNTTLTGDTQEDLCYSEVSNGVNDLAYSLELPALHEIYKNRRLSNASTSPIDATENMSCLPDISHTTSLMSNIDYFFTFLEDTENKNLHDKRILLHNYLSEENSTNTPLAAVKIERLDKSNQESVWVTEESTSVMEHLKTGTIQCPSEQILPAKDIWNVLPHIDKKCLAFSEPAANLKQEIINFQVNQGADSEICTRKLKKLSKKKNKLKVNEKECFPEFTKLNSNNNTHDVVCQKLIKNEIKTEKLAPTPTKSKTRQSKSIQKGKKAEFKEHGITKTDRLKLETEKPKLHLEANQKAQTKVTLNQNHGMGPKNTIIDCCDTKALLSNNVHISRRNVPCRLVRNNNATRTRVRLAGERRRRRLYAQLYHMSDDDLAKRAFAKGIILLLVIIYAFYSVKSFLNLYLRNVFGICDNGLNKVLCY